MGLFTHDSVIVDAGTRLLLIVALTSPAQISQVIFSGSLRGAGDTKFVAYSSLVSIGIIRPLITYILCFPLGLGLIGAWFSLFVDQYLRLLFTGLRFSKGKWTKIKI